MSYTQGESFERYAVERLIGEDVWEEIDSFPTVEEAKQQQSLYSFTTQVVHIVETEVYAQEDQDEASDT